MSNIIHKRPTVATVDLDALAYNYRSVRDFVGPPVKFMAVVKADAYGHGAVECSLRLQAEGVDWFAVATVEEGVELRDAGIERPTLILGGFWPGQEEELLDHGLTPVIFRIDQARALAKAASQRRLTAEVHVKIDTGMGRIGVRSDDISDFAAELSTIPDLKVTGLLTHFAVADEIETSDFTEQQITGFYSAVEAFKLSGHTPEHVDLANSPGAIVHPTSRGTMVRIGGLLYGLGGDVLPGGIPSPNLKPVMSVTSKIAQVKTILPGESVGYGRTFIAERPTTVATVAIGYHDGVPRKLSNNGWAIVRGRKAPIIGRISMDWTTINVTDVKDVAVNDDVTIIGTSGKEIIRAEDIARMAETISYEITCGISRRVIRNYV